MFRRISALVCVLFAVFTLSAACAETTAVVVTPNGGPVRVRSTCSTKEKSNILTSLKMGVYVTIVSTDNGWAEVRYTDPDTKKPGSGYIRAEFLSTGENAEQRTVTQRKATVKTTTGNGWVNLRQGMSTRSKRLMRCKPGTAVTVLSENGVWSKVRVESTGEVGYMMSAYIRK